LIQQTQRANSEGNLLESCKLKPTKKLSWLQRGEGFFNQVELFLSRKNHSIEKSAEEPDFKDIVLEDVLSSPELLSFFREFLRSEHSEENLEFWLYVQEYKNESNPKKCEDLVEEIFTEFIKSGSLKEINVNFEIKKRIKEKMNSVQKDIFDEAEESIFQLMRTDSYQRFKSKHTSLK